jgi:hypothetical protein
MEYPAVEIPVNSLVPIGVVTASIIAGFFSFVSLVLAKEQKVSEFRQQWIDSLREDLSQFISKLMTMKDVKKNIALAKEKKQKPDFSLSDVKELHTAISEAYTRIILRLNPNENCSYSKDLTESLNKINKLMKEKQWNEISSGVEELRGLSQQVLKTEWTRVKEGEPTFKWSKRIAILMFTVAIGIAVFMFHNI